MRTLIVYDSMYGNTEKVARAIGEAIGGEVKIIRPPEVDSSLLNNIDLLVIGSPTQGGRSTSAINTFLNKLPKSIAGINVAAFDTRVSAKWVGIFGYAAGKIAGNLKGKGGHLVAPPEPFLVAGTKGPLKDGELERAAAWAREISKK